MTFLSATRTLALIGALSAMFVTTSLAQTAPSELGTWRLNVAKATFTPGPAPKASSVTFSAAGQGISAVIDGVGPDNAKVRWEYTANFDGKSYPVKGNPDGDMVVAKRVNTNTIESSYTLKGKPTLVVTRVLSADGKTLTVTQTGMNGQGQKVNNVLVFERS